jgi:hypothetical protein
MTPAKLNGRPTTSDGSAETTTRVAAPSPSFALASLQPELESHAELDLATLIYHIEQSDATATDGYWHAAVNEARSALESLLRDIVLQIGPTNGKEVASGNGNGTPFSICRRTLAAAGFLDTRESDILHFAYGLSSAKGSHPGVTDEAWRRLSRQILFSVTQYVLRRYGEWKRYRPPTTVLLTAGAPRTTPTVAKRFRQTLACFLRVISRGR